MSEFKRGDKVRVSLSQIVRDGQGEEGVYFDYDEGKGHPHVVHCNGSTYVGWKYCKLVEEAKELTVAEISEKLGYEVKVVK